MFANQDGRLGFSGLAVPGPRRFSMLFIHDSASDPETAAMRPTSPLSFLLPALCCCALLTSASVATAGQIDLTFGSLPSAQGWTFTTGGSPVATEAQTFTATASALTLNTMAFGITGSGTSAFYARSTGVNGTEAVVMKMRGRLLEHEGDFANTFVGGGFSFGFANGATFYQMGITPTQIRNVAGTILSSAYDNTQFHDYRLEWSPPSTLRYYVDNTLISTNSAGLAQALTRITLGDVTGAANAHADITGYQFLQGQATPARATSWGRIKQLGR
jgi:hypothetical protein